jgi:hypothetical protein
MTTTAQLTKTPTTYDQVRLGDLIDGTKIRQIDSGPEGVQLGFENEDGGWDWAPIQPANTPVSVYR